MNDVLFENIKASVEACENMKCDIVPMLLKDAKDLVSLIERHEPKDVEDEHPSGNLIDYYFGDCPNCKNVVGTRKIHGNITYCSHCGQSLRWRFDE